MKIVKVWFKTNIEKYDGNGEEINFYGEDYFELGGDFKREEITNIVQFDDGTVGLHTEHYYLEIMPHNVNRLLWEK